MSNLAYDLVKATELAAIAAYEWVGKNDSYAADGAAVDAMREYLNTVAFRGTVVIGEGKKDEAPELYTGEVLGSADSPQLDLAVDPVEATTSVALARNHAISVIAAGEPGSLLSAPDTYMEKLAVPGLAAKVVSLDFSTAENLSAIAQSLNKKPEELRVMVLDRPRHERLIGEIKEFGAEVELITDGDVAAICVCLPQSGIDAYMGIGASAEAVLAATAIKIMGGEMLCRFKPKDEVAERDIVNMCGEEALTKTYTAQDLAGGDNLIFVASGILDGYLVAGVKKIGERRQVSSILIQSGDHEFKHITNEYPAYVK